MFRESLINEILSEPDVHALVQRVNSALDKEKKARKRFYEIVEENKKMEFINGEIVFQSPVKLSHNSATERLCRLISIYVDTHELGVVGVEKILVSLTRNDYEPDICFWRNTKAKKFKQDQMQFPAPDFVVEVLSPSTEKHDREIKFKDYATHHVEEYWIIDPDKKFVEQYLLKDGEYELNLKSKSGTIISSAVVGFSIPIAAIFDSKENLKALKQLQK